MRLIVCFACFSFVVHAQVETGAITGTVTDATNSAVPLASVKVTSTETGRSIALKTTAQGEYATPPLRPGHYRIEVEAAGFRRSVEEFQLDINQRARADFSLEVGDVSQSVIVSAQATLLSTETAALGSVRSEREVANLPLNGRDFVQLIHLAPGVNTAGGGGSVNVYTGSNRQGIQGASVNGARATDNNFLYDGIQSQDNDQSVLAFLPNVEAIQEFKVETNAMDARFGRSGGGTINLILKSGTNKFHGSAFEFLRNSAMDAKNYFDGPGPIPPFKMNQFGMTFGGPISIPRLYNGHDRTFFFGAYQGKHLRQAQTYLNTVPTAAFKNGDFSASRLRIFDPATTRRNPANPNGFLRDVFPENRIPSFRFDKAARNVIALYPDPNLPGTASNYLNNPVLQNDTDQFDTRVDHHFPRGDQLFGRYSYSDTFVVQPGLLPAPAVGACCGRPGHTFTRGQQAVIGYTRVLKPTLTLELRAGFTRLAVRVKGFTQDRAWANELGIPGINVSPNFLGLPMMNATDFTGIGEMDFVPFLKIHNNFEYSANVTWNHAAHTVQAGYDVGRRQGNYLSPPGPVGVFTFTGQFTQNPVSVPGTGISMADFLLGLYTSSRIDVQPEVGQRRWELSGFVQDNYKVSKRVTLNFGLRWEIITPWTEAFDRQSNFVPALRDVFPVNSPQIPGRTFTDLRLTDFAPRFGISWRLNNKTVVRTGYGIFYSFPGVPTGNLPSQAPPYAGNFPFNNNSFNPESARLFSQGFPSDRPARFDTTGRNFKYWVPNDKDAYVQQWNLNVQREIGASVAMLAYVGSKGTHLYLLPNVNQPVPGSAPVAQRRPYPNLGDGTGVARKGNSTYHSLQASFERRFSRGLTLLSAYTWAHAINDGEGGAQNMLNYRAERGAADFDVRQRLVLSMVYELPFGKGRMFFSALSGWREQLLGGWQMNTITTFQGGSPFTPFMSQNGLGSGVGAQRPNRIRDGSLGGSERSVTRYFDTTAFVAPPPFTFGNSPRNALYGPGTDQIDFSISKNFLLRTGDSPPSLQFRAEAFNLFNTPQFNNPDASIGGSTAGKITSAGTPALLFRTSRQIQMALVLRF